MIPILFEKTETAFTSSGIGRLVDCIECLVPEELNTGIYECDFQYPVTGELFDEIQLGRIVGVTHDDTGDLQPFDIVSCSRPIDGVVSFHAVHVSYRLSRHVCIPDPNYPVDTFSKVLTFFDNAYPRDGQFDFKGTPGETTPTGYLAAAADGIPRSVRDYIGGVDGCYFDTFGGEVIWNKFDVQFTAHRGTLQDFQIRYGVNMMDYKEEQDGQETYTLAIPFWKGQGNLVVGGLVDSGLTPYDRQLCVAMDLTDRFETEPTTAQLEAEALSIMTSGQPNLPRRTIEVDFIRLQDLEDYGDYSDLATCELGDSLSVVFPMYNITGTFRIVKVIWDALRDRFDTMTLGSLQTTLAEALGVGGGITNVGGGGGGSVVSFTQVLSSGTKIGIITIDGTPTDIYAPSGGGGDTVTWSQILQTGTKIATIDINGSETDVYAPTGGGGTKTAWYGTSSTAESTAAKVATTSTGDFSLTAGSIVFVKFDHRYNTVNTTLNVDGTGAKTIKQNGAAPQLGVWQDGEVVGFAYDGTNFELFDGGMASTTDWGVTKLSSSVSDGYVNVAANGAAVKSAYDLADAANTLAGTKSTVAWNQIQATGTKIAEITIDGGSPTDVYAPAGGGGGSYTATAPIDITNNVISHDDAIGTAGNKGGTYSSSAGYYMPYFEYDAKGHITEAYNLGQLIGANTTYTGSNPVTLAPYSWGLALRSSSLSGFVMFAGGTTQSQTIQTDSNSMASYKTLFRVADVQAYDMTTFEPVIVDWSCDKVFGAGGSITVTISIAQAYSHDIRWFPILTYATAAM